ncbi:ATP-binding protein [Streptomyces sp. NPDC002547]
MLEQVRSAVAAPLMIVTVLLGVAVIAWQTTLVSTGYLLTGLALGILVSAVVAARRARTAATAVQRARDAELQRGLEAASAVEKYVLWAAEELCRGGRPGLPDRLPPVEGAGLAAELVALLAEMQVQAVGSLFRVHDESQSALLLGMLRHLARREHALVGRALEELDGLQRLTDDPELLDKAYTIDHLVTRLRRLVESKAVLGGESLRSLRRPVTVVTVLRGAVSEVVQYQRVSVAAGTVGAELALPGHVGPDLTHLVAELIENACDNSDPSTQVHVRAARVPKGLMIEVEDRAVPLDDHHRWRLNEILAAPDKVDVSAQVREGKIGLLTAAKIAHRHGMSVRLTENSTGGATALVVVPDKLLVPIRSDSVRGPGAAPAAPPQVQQPSFAAPTPPQLARSGQQPAHVAAGHTAPIPASGTEPADAPPLPQRTRGQLRMPEPTHRPARPTRAARADLAAVFRDSMKAARADQDAAPAPPPQASGPSDPPAAHP